jgi:hypothetical protein
MQMQIPVLPGIPNRPSWWVVPLGQFRRRRLADISVRDANGKRLNLLTRDQHGKALADVVTTNYVLAKLPSGTFPVDAQPVNQRHSLLSDFFTAGLPSGKSPAIVRDFLVLKKEYAGLVERLSLAPTDKADRGPFGLTGAFARYLEGWLSLTQYLCWVDASPGEVLNLEVSYTSSDSNHELEIGSIFDLPGRIKQGLGMSPEAHRRRRSWLRQLGITPIDYEFKAPPDPGPNSYYFLIDPPRFTSVTYVDWEPRFHFHESHSEDETQEVDSALPSAHIHSAPGRNATFRSKTQTRTIRAYFRCSPYRHKQLLGAAALNIVVVWLLAKGALPIDLAEPLQGLIIAAPSIVIAFLTQQQRHYYAQVMRRHRFILWGYLALSVAFLVSVAFGDRDHTQGLEPGAWALGVALATASAGIFGLQLPLGGSYERVVRFIAFQKRKRRARSGKGNLAMWHCYGDAVTLYAVISLVLSGLFAVLAGGAMLLWWHTDGTNVFPEKASHLSLNVDALRVENRIQQVQAAGTGQEQQSGGGLSSSQGQGLDRNPPPDTSPHQSGG